jgi:hypothetical protein
MFEYPVKCQWEGHEIGEGHLLLHILEHIHIYNFPVDVPELTKFPMKDHYLNSLLAVLILSDGYEEELQDCILKQNFDEICMGHLSEMVDMLLSSQYLLLSTLSATRLLEGDPDGLAGFSICVNKALGLTNDMRVTSIILPLVSQVQALIQDLEPANADEHAVATLEATNTIDRLHTHLAKLFIYGQQNGRVLSCARAPGASSPASGWRAPYTC